MNEYIVEINLETFVKYSGYLYRVISYKKEDYKICLHKEKAHKYKTEKNATKAAELCKGIVKIY